MTGPTPRHGDDPTERPEAFETIDGDLVLYDRSNTDAWIQSSVAIDFEAVRADGSV